MRTASVLAAAFILAAAAAALGVDDPHGIGYDGRDWTAMSEQAKRAYVAGFLAGAIAQQALDSRRGASGAVEAAVADITRTHRATFPFGASVYKTVLDDYYFYRNNLPVRIYRALIERNTEMRKGSR